MAKNSTLPNLRDTLVFCGFLLDCNQEDFSDNREWANECRWHKSNIQSLLKFLDEGKEDKSMIMSEKSYKKCIATFGESFVKKLFKGVTVVPYDVPPVDGQKLLESIKAKGSASRTKEVKQPTGFFNEEARKGFQDALFSRKSNGYHEAVWPKVATTFSELRQARIEGELAEQFTMLTQNILQSSEFTADVKAQKLAALASEYSQLSKGGN